MPSSKLPCKAPVVIHSWDLVFPNDANPRGTMFGGRLMALMDRIGAIAAGKYAETEVVTVSSDAIIFREPIRIGDRIETIARVVYAGTTSLIVRVDVFAEDSLSSQRKHCTDAHLTFVALDAEGKPCPVPPLALSTEEEKRDAHIAAHIKKEALERSKRIAAAENIKS